MWYELVKSQNPSGCSQKLRIPRPMAGVSPVISISGNCYAGKPGLPDVGVSTIRLKYMRAIRQREMLRPKSL